MTRPRSDDVTALIDQLARRACTCRGKSACSACQHADLIAAWIAELERDLAATRLAALPQTGDTAAVLLAEVVRDSRIRHDHDYPMEFGPHHCDGCDLEDRIRAALTTGAGS